MIVHDKNKSKVALNAEANRIRLDKDMRTLLTLFKSLTKQESGDDNASPKAITHFSPISYFGTILDKIMKYSDCVGVKPLVFAGQPPRNVQGLYESYT